jgi:predicted unusual protein kinase regulating ubiquinone biosynthesis (AarF/ABC1/UbiB family)
MDLCAIELLRCGLGLVGQARPGSDVDRLLAEFASVTRRELDLANEGKNIERFARDFADDGGIHLPNVYWQYSGTCTLTMENVSYIKLDNMAALENVGIDSTRVAHELARIMLQQIFVTHFLHADPHLGNLFVKPLPHPDEARTAGFAPDEPVPYFPGRPFQLVLIDCGMAVEIPERARIWLRDFVIGLGLRDARRIVQSYATGGLLRPGVDPARVEQLTAALLDHFQGMLIGLMPDLSQDETRQFFAEYHDMVENYPFRIPLDLLFLYRSLGIMGALVKALDPNFDLSRAAAPFARQLVWHEYQQNWRQWVQAVTNLGQTLVTPPVQLDQVWRQAQALFALPPPLAGLLNPPVQGRTVHANQEADVYPALQRLEQTVRRLSWIVVALCLLMAKPPGGISALQTGATLDFVGIGLLMLALVFLARALSDPK